MLNAETPRLKFALYGAHSSLGNALLCELLTRQHEVVALVDDLNSMTVRPGLRAKPGDLFDGISVSQSVAGMDAVICLFDSPSVPTASGRAESGQHQGFYQAVDALLTGLPKVGVERLLLTADLSAHSEEPDVAAALQRLAEHPLKWTLVDALTEGEDLSIEDFSNLEGLAAEDRRVQLRRIAAGMVDELESPQHLHQQIHFRF
ncbi:NADH-flavin reductase [Stutzerimonas zhaodongensis]|uniref:NADH-flavin reductase n=1 Tax=Stutzerimonas zhaodongensis TaxID=1176257 RepID=A0A3M2HPJ0_9GAMM|nr:NAD(P)H-binding protein [Stutzerimonas zhaodongensis]MCQ4318204.1 NAD(P)H-binding protein [Stutzerimonas zhaodongensis]RMH88157.1 NADH-flavin reductase [Stutzerimonas zhaodongensis]